MSDDFVPIRTFHYRHEAELARSALEARGIEARVAADDAAGQAVGLGFVRGVTVLVRQEDAAPALAVLGDEPAPEA